MPLPLHHLRAGVIGTGFIAPVHIEALRRLGIQVTAICGSTKSAQATAAQWSIPEVYGDYDYASMYRSPNVDASLRPCKSTRRARARPAGLRRTRVIVPEQPRSGADVARTMKAA